MKNELFREIVSTVRYSIDASDVRTRAMTMINSNKLISDPESSRLFYDCAIGVKTGSTVQGGKCLVAAATKNGASVVAVLLGVTQGGSKLDRMSTVYEDAKTIMDLALTEQFVSVSPANLGLNPTISMPLTGADAKEISLCINLPSDPITLSRMSANRIQSDPSVVQAVPSISFVAAPVSEGDLCGTIDFSINGSALFTGELVASQSVETQSGELSVSTVATPRAGSGCSSTGKLVYFAPRLAALCNGSVGAWSSWIRGFHDRKTKALENSKTPFEIILSPCSYLKFKTERQLFL